MQSQLTIEGATRTHHPFRRYMRRALAQQQQVRDDSDIRLFAVSFSAFFVCFYTFIL